MENVELPHGGQEDGGLHTASLPHDEEAERSVIGVLLTDNNKFDELDIALSEEDFYSTRHRLIYRHFTRLKGKEGRPADVITVRNSLADAGDLAQAGGKDYLVDLYSLGELATNFGEYVQLVRDKAILRRLRDEAAQIQRMVHWPGELNCAEILDKAEEKMFRLSDEYNNRLRDSISKIGDLADTVNKQVTELYERIEKGESAITGVETKFTILDRYTSGLQPSDLIVLAARPSIGKTSFALDIIRNVCSATDVAHTHANAVALFSLEMSSEQIAKRLLAATGQIDQYRLRSGYMRDGSGGDWERFSRGLAVMEKWPLWVDDTPILSVMELRSRARRIERKCAGDGTKLKLIVVDYLQLMTGEGRAQENRAVEVSGISRGLKALARELQVPVLALSQMSRKIEDRMGKRPQLSDLRDSGGIEQDADLIMFLSRKDKGTDFRGTTEDIELIIGKHRNGPVGSINYRFTKRYTTFEEVEGQLGYDPDDPSMSHGSGDPEEYTAYSA